MVRSDCGQSQACYYPVADGCSAVGVCLEDLPGFAASGCEDKPIYCACDGGCTQTVCSGHDGYLGAPVSRAVDVLAECSNDAGSSLVSLPDGGAQQ